MKRGPVTGARPADMRTMAEKALAAWGAPLPDWVDELARFADAAGLRIAAERIGYSSSTLSTVINGRYAGDVDRVADAVRGALMGAVVSCPILGEIGRDQCLDEQRKPKSPTNSTRMALWRACRGGCPHSKQKGDRDD
ncbi:transcriptional regulator [Afifella pfennigii]|uniref:transcriptional regulator n=1 Tax=Afifella pfennigii TaxID=209897 RepID=UPI000AB0FA8E|nr:transcriptional regulator [Afifella pfennigii]